MAMARSAEGVAALAAPVERGRWRRAVLVFCRRRPLGAFGAAIVVMNLVVAAGAPMLAPYDPLATRAGSRSASASMSWRC